jgi:hypothetical protein
MLGHENVEEFFGFLLLLDRPVAPQFVNVLVVGKKGGSYNQPALSQLFVFLLLNQLRFFLSLSRRPCFRGKTIIEAIVLAFTTGWTARPAGWLQELFQPTCQSVEDNYVINHLLVTF